MKLERKLGETGWGLQAMRGGLGFILCDGISQEHFKDIRV